MPAGGLTAALHLPSPPSAAGAPLLPGWSCSRPSPLPTPHAPPILPRPVPTPNLAPAAGGSTALPTNSSATGSLLFSPPLLHLHLRPPPHTPHTPRAPVLSITYPCFPHPSNLLSWPQSRNPPVSAGPVPPNLRPQHPSSLQTLFQAPLFADARAAPEPAAGPTCQCP